MNNYSSETNYQLFLDLQALSDTAFPKQCRTCGRIYRSPDDFFRQCSPPTRGSGLKASFDDDDQDIVELYRNCVCGSTLMDLFQNRRDTTALGVERRVRFSRLMVMLQQKGLSPELARFELQKVINGEHSQRLEALGIQLRVNDHSQ